VATELVAGLIAAGEEVAAGELVRFELLAGVRDPELHALEEFYSAIDWVPLTAEGSRVAGLLARRYRLSHAGIDDVDYLVAASAIVFDAELMTTNARRFPMLGDLPAPY